MHRVLAMALCVVLAGCIGSPVMKSEALSFSDVIEDATNKLLVLNVLRARDKAPLHFADIPVIRESMQQNASLGFIDFSGHITGTTQRSSRSGGLGVQFTPSFEITNLYSKDFNTGMTTPIDAKIVKYWLDRGLDRRIVLLLFFSAAEIVETQSAKGPVNTIRIMNSPREAIDVIKTRTQAFSGPEAFKCDTQSDFERYLKLVNSLKTFFAHSYRERRLLARGLSLDVEKDPRTLQAFAALDQTKTQLVFDKGLSAYNLYALSPDSKVAFCLYESTGPSNASSQYEFITAGGPAISSKQNCFRSVVEVPPEDTTHGEIIETPISFPPRTGVAAPSRYCEIYNRFTAVAPQKDSEYPKVELRLHIRSVGEIFQFLGDLVYYQEEVKRHLASNPQLKVKLNTPLTFGYCEDDPSAGCDDVFIRFDGEACNARFTLTYRDHDYHVANFSDADRGVLCGSTSARRKDHTLEILAVLHQLVGLHLSASDFRPTPAVQVLP